MNRLLRASRLILVLMVPFLGGCGNGDRSPSAATSPPATAAPAPQPTPTPVMTNCERIGLGPGPGTGCPRESPSFLAEVEAAIERVRGERPDVVGGERVHSVGQYYMLLIENLEKAGLCADFDGEELQVKNSNAFNDQYHVMTSQLLLQRGQKAYRSTCSPAAFPTPPPPLPETPGCSLKPSKDKACGREQSLLLDEVEGALAKLIQEHPEHFDLEDVLPGTNNFYRIVNPDAYFRGVITNLNARGLCVRYDGVELAVKKENRYSEQFDIWSGEEGFVRRGPGSYRVTCFPAAF